MKTTGMKFINVIKYGENTTNGCIQSHRLMVIVKEPTLESMMLMVMMMMMVMINQEIHTIEGITNILLVMMLMLMLMIVWKLMWTNCLCKNACNLNTTAEKAS
jgi:hypothetical protein